MAQAAQRVPKHLWTRRRRFWDSCVQLLCSLRASPFSSPGLSLQFWKMELPCQAGRLEGGSEEDGMWGRSQWGKGRTGGTRVPVA